MDQASTSTSQFGANAIPLPLWALLLLTVASALPLIWAWRSVPSAPARFLIVAIWFRLVFDGWAFVTLRSYGGLKPITLLSLATIAAGVLCVDPRAWLTRGMLPFYTLILLMAASSVLNGEALAFLDPALRLIYLSLLMLAALLAFRREGVARMSGWLLVAFTPAFLLQIGSVVLGVARVTERDRSAAYVGGFGHESAFALLVIAFLVVARFATRLGVGTRLLLAVGSVVSLLLANYRTAILAVAPLIAWQFAELVLASLLPRYRNAALILFAIVGLGVAGAGVVAGGERYDDVWQMASNPAGLLREPDSFNRAEQQAGSGRSYLWSQYYYGWESGSTTQQAIGRGPESAAETFRVYAQNTLLAYLYETGVAGVLLMLLLWTVMLWFAATAAWPTSGYLVTMHVTLLLLNMSTMPFDMIDGLVLMAIAYGYSLYAHYERQDRRIPQPVLRTPFRTSAA